jgi:MFS superfamily sulfate permease-like transporter
MMLIPGAGGSWEPIPAAPGKQTEPGLIIYRFGADLFYANYARFIDDVQALVDRAPTPIRCFVVDASAITDLDFSAASAIRDLLADLTARNVTIVFARVSPYLRADMDRHGITAAAGADHLFATLHEAIAAVRAVVDTQPLRRPATQPAGPLEA